MRRLAEAGAVRRRVLRGKRMGVSGGRTRVVQKTAEARLCSLYEEVVM